MLLLHHCIECFGLLYVVFMLSCITYILFCHFDRQSVINLSTIHQRQQRKSTINAARRWSHSLKQIAVSHKQRSKTTAKFVFKMSAFRLDTRAQTGAPLSDCCSNKTLVKLIVTSRWERRYTVKAVHMTDNSSGTSRSIISCLCPDISGTNKPHID